MASRANGKRTTLADLMAAAAIGAIDTSAEVITGQDADALAADAANAASAAVTMAPTAPTAAATVRNGSVHECEVPGCRHGGDAAAHAPQPDRQVKMSCPGCGAVARMTGSALRRCGAIRCGTCTSADEPTGRAFVPAAHRAYSRRTA